ncbi:MAG: phosphoenolpyruvate synthase [Candidatus Paceibacterota bacterium]
MKPFIKLIRDITINDIPEVGGKNASLGEMFQHLEPKGVRIPDGFVVTASAYRHFITEGRVKDVVLKDFIEQTLKGLDTKDLKQLQHVGKLIREAVISAHMPEDLEAEIRMAYRRMEKQYKRNVDVAVRSSATAEDLPGASFAGQQETFLNIRGGDDLIIAVEKCIASLFTDRAISYRHDKGFAHTEIALSVGVQKMVRSDLGVSGIMFTVDTESGFKDVVNINATWGLGEMIVQGEVIPDEYIVYKPLLADKKLVPIISKKLGKKEQKMIYATGSVPTKIVPVDEKDRNAFVLNDKEIITLAKWGVLIEEHYSAVHKKWTPMDTEWAKDGETGKLYIVQARPETVQAEKDFSYFTEYKRTQDGVVLTKGASVGSAIVSGKARVILDTKDIHQFKKGEILVTDMTDPDWEPIMKIASGIITDKGGRTSHAAIISRELGIACVVGCINATQKIKTGDIVTIDTTASEGVIFAGDLKFIKKEHNLGKLKKPKVKIMMNIATPDTAFEKSFIPNSGVGLAREEFIIASEIGIHPNLLINFEKFKKQTHDSTSAKLVKEIEARTVGYVDKTQYYVDTLAYGIAKIGAAFYPKPVIVRFSDFKTNEYRELLGGDLYEPHEENPMLGWRGASRYYHPLFADAFALELMAIKKVRQEMGLTNVQVMVPFCRTPQEGMKVKALIKKAGLLKDDLKVYVMCEIPANIIRAKEFLEIFDGMSIGSNDLTQLLLGIDRDGNERIRSISNETDTAVTSMISDIIKLCRKEGKYIGICGQAPSDIPQFAEFIAEAGIESISLSPDSVIKTLIDFGRRGL